VRWIIERCLAKDPEERYASTKDLARDLESLRDHLSETSTSAARAATERPKASRRGWVFPAVLAFLAGTAIALFAARSLRLFEPALPQIEKLTFRRGSIVNARLAPDGRSAVYGAAWDGKPVEIFTSRVESPESKSLGLPPASLLSISRQGELAISLGWHSVVGFEATGLLARVPVTGGAPREVLEDVEGAAWSPDGKDLAVIRHVGDKNRLEFPIGSVLAETAGWFSDPKFSRDGKFLAFWDHPERGDNAGTLVLLEIAARRRVEGPRVGGIAGFVWTPRGDLLFAEFGAMQRISRTGKARLHRPTLTGFLPEDLSDEGMLLLKRWSTRREIVAGVEGEARERNLTWLDWSFPDDLSADGRTVLFDEQSRGRSNYLCYVRKTDGSPAVLLGPYKGYSLSRDGRWALAERLDVRQLVLVPTGAGAPRPLPKLDFTYQWAVLIPDGKRLVVWGNEPGRGGRLYVQAIDGGAPRPITPEGYGLSFGGQPVSPDGRFVAVVGPDRMLGLVPLDGGAPRPLPGGRPEESAWGWTADSKGLYVGSIGMPAKVEICDVATGARRPWKEIAPPDPAGVLAVGPILVSPDGKSYVYSYRRNLDDLFLASGVK
jgi:hypothetical protein